MSNLQTACKYFGCQIEVNGEIHTMWGIVPDGVWYTENRTNRVAKWGEWKPILKPLSEITDEDAVEVAKIINSLDRVINIKFMTEVGKEYLKRNKTKLPVDVIDYLRSKFYNV